MRAATWQALAIEARLACSRTRGWQAILRRNAWFERVAARRLRQLAGAGVPASRTVFAYSYAAGDIFEQARRLGWRTVLGQIDPGPMEDRLVQELHASLGIETPIEPIPDDYWRRWRREIDLSDIVMVNSSWSKDALLSESVPEHKIRIVPLSLETGDTTARPRDVPDRFVANGRPLKLLFLGQVNIRKGAHILIDAVRKLPDTPFTLDIVGPLQLPLPAWVSEDHRIRIHGSVPRSETRKFYEDADAFVFPTFSDGFGLTQLEARSFGLPVVASRRCGEVVTDGHDGIILAKLDADSLAAAIRRLVEQPVFLKELQKNAHLAKPFSLAALGRRLTHLE